MSTEGEQGLERQLRELKEAKTRYDLAVRATTDGIWDWNILTGEEYFSPRWCEILGYERSDSELVPTYEFWASRIHVDDRERIEAAVRAHLETGVMYDVDYRHRHRSGEYRWQNSRGQAVFKAGEPVRMVGAIRDITSLREAQTKHIDLEARLLAERNNARISDQFFEWREVIETVFRLDRFESNCGLLNPIDLLLGWCVRKNLDADYGCN